MLATLAVALLELISRGVDALPLQVAPVFVYAEHLLRADDANPVGGRLVARGYGRPVDAGSALIHSVCMGLTVRLLFALMLP